MKPVSPAFDPWPLARIIILLIGTISTSLAIAAEPRRIPRLDPGEGGVLGPQSGLTLAVLAPGGSPVPTYEVFGAGVRLAWSDQGLHFAVDVQDPEISEAADLMRLYEADSVEFFLGAGEPGAGVLQMIVSPGRAPAAGSRVCFLDYRNRHLRETAPPRGWTKVTRTAGGYHVDAFLAWDNFAFMPGDGAAIRTRVTINDGNHGRKRSLRWEDPAIAYDFFQPPEFNLSSGASGETDAPIFVTADYPDFSSTAVTVVTAAARSGQRVAVEIGGTIRTEGELLPDGPRAVARLRLPVPAVGSRLPALEVYVAGRHVRTVIPADADEQRRQAFLGGGHEAEANESGDDLSPRFSTVVFADEAFPGFGYANPDLIRQIAGPVRTSVQYFDRAGSPVVSAQKPGWYAAVATVSSDALKASFKVRTLLHRAAPPSRPAGNENDPAPGGREEHELWHRVNQAIGDITRYDYVVGLPRDYATSTELLPAVFYLHGSGGGSDESWPVTQKEGIQAGLASGRHGSFIAVSLRSPGGWFPPAVRDVVAEVVRKYRVDPRRVLLTGFSMGGAGTWAVALDYPGLFAAIAPVGGGPGEPGRAAALAGVSVWVFNGQDDSVMTSRAAATMVGALRTAGVDGRLTELPHANHVESLQEVYALDAFYTWLLAQRRDGGTETAALHPSP